MIRIKSKFYNKKTTYRGERFDSKAERRRWQALQLMERAGEITELRRQVKYVLIPAQRVNGRVVERECAYYADFVYSLPSGLQVIEDVKGVRTDVYKIKRKLMLYVHGIRISEVE